MKKLISIGMFLLIFVAGMFTASLQNPKITKTAEANNEETNSSDELNMFNGYASWPSSENKNPNDKWAQFLYQLKEYDNLGHTFIDINGDGLSDMLSHGGNNFKSTVWLNTGNNEFQLIYKCFVYDAKWYGDCAIQ